jgi:hypothetical protein
MEEELLDITVARLKRSHKPCQGYISSLRNNFPILFALSMPASKPF